MKEKIKAGENIELDGIVIDNKTSIAEAPEKEEAKAEEAVTSDEKPEVSVDTVTAPEEATQESASTQEIPLSPEATETSAVPSVPLDIPITGEMGAYGDYLSSLESSYEKPYSDSSNAYYQNKYEGKVELDIDENVAIQRVEESITDNLLVPHRNTIALLKEAVSLLSELDNRGYVTGPDHDNIKVIKAKAGSLVSETDVNEQEQPKTM